MGSLVRFLLVILLFLALCQGMPRDKKDESKEKEDDKKEISGDGADKVDWQTKETKDEHSLEKCEKDEDCRHVSRMYGCVIEVKPYEYMNFTVNQKRRGRFA